MGSRTFNFLTEKKLNAQIKMACKKGNCDYKSVKTATYCYQVAGKP